MSFEDDHYGRALSDVCSPFAAFRPPRRVSVSQGAADNLFIKQPGGYVGPWSADETPYMVEPMDMLASRRHEAVCFVGPARTGKTMGLLDGWSAHVVINDPGDFLIVQMTQDKAREFSRTRVDRMLRNSPSLAAMKSASSQDDNTHDKSFRHGMWLRIAWPTVPNLSSSDYRYVALTDYDRMPDDIGGEGSAFSLGLKRTTTFLSRGMCMVESSPGRDLIDPNWRPATLHEAPPAGGILGIYNGSDRRRWYWRCLDCRDWYEAAPGLALFRLPSDDELIEMVRDADIESLAGKYSQVVCPHCGTRTGSRHKNALNATGRWVADGQVITGDGELIGDAQSSTTAGYWLGGVAAAYQSWRSLVSRYLLGLRSYALSGNEQALHTTVNTDQAMPYMSRHLIEASRHAQGPEDRKDNDLKRFIVPDETRFLAAAVDIQGGSTARFVVQVHAVGPNLEQWLVDRFNITESKRPGMGTEFAPIDPAAYPEDWDLLTEKVVLATYRTSVEGKELRVKLTGVDSGGEDGVTANAYAWFRRLRKVGLNRRVVLVKGASTKTAPIIRESMVGARQKGDTGDIPLLNLNPNLLKDIVSTGMRRQAPGPGYYHFPGWLPRAFFDELQSEVRAENGTWQQVRKRNEAFDLACYIMACCLRLGADKIKDWSNPPLWASSLFSNPELVTREERRELKDDVLPALVEAPRLARPVRRSNRSSYLG